MALRTLRYRPMARIIHATQPRLSFPARRLSTLQTEEDIEEYLSKPTWSVESLLPSSSIESESPTITSKQLHHLLRLSALPLPQTPEEEAKMLSTLSSQLHFVREIQKVDTAGVEPLRSLRDETAAAEEEQTIGLEAVKEALENEEVVGKYYKRVRRRTDVPVDTKGAEDWDVLGSAQKRVGKYFVVDSTGKE